MNPIKKTSGGFTLIEIMLAISLIVIVLSAFAGILLPLKKSLEQARENQEIQEALSVVWGRLEQDLSFAFVPNGVEQNPFKGERQKMTFYCLDSIRFAGAPLLPGARQVVYQLEPGGTAVQWSENPLVAKKNQAPFYSLGKGFGLLQFQYLNQEGAWLTQWREKEWPIAIQVSGIFVSKKGRAIAFEKSFYPKS